MVKLGSPFAKYSATSDGTITTGKCKESTASKPLSSLFPFIIPGFTIRDYVKRKIFKATKEEVSHLLKSTSVLNITGKPSSTKPDKNHSKSSKKSKKREAELENGKDFVSNKNGFSNEQFQDNETVKKQIEQPLDSAEIPYQGEPATIDVEPSIQITEPAVQIKLLPHEIQSSKKNQDKDEEFTNSSYSSSLSDTTCSLHKRKKWFKKLKRSKNASDKQAKAKSTKNPDEKLGEEEKDSNEKVKPVKWSKRMKKMAIRTCRYLGYGAQMVSPMTPYSDIPMPLTLDSFQTIYPHYYGSNHYYSYSSCDSVYGYSMNHYGFSY